MPRLRFLYDPVGRIARCRGVERGTALSATSSVRLVVAVLALLALGTTCSGSARLAVPLEAPEATPSPAPAPLAAIPPPLALLQQLIPTAAAAVELPPDQLRRELSGRTLASVSDAHGVDPAAVSAALKASVHERIDQMAAQRRDLPPQQVALFKEQMDVQIDNLMSQPVTQLPPAAAPQSIPGQAAANCAAPPTGYVPLTDLIGGTYQGVEGGLYPGGTNEPAGAYAQRGAAMSALVRPRNGAGQPDPHGAIVLLSIGMSNATQEFTVFKRLADADPRKHPQVMLVDGAQGGADAERVARSSDPYWTFVDTRLREAGVTAAQVQAIWLKEAIAGEHRPFPADAQRLQDDLGQIVEIARQRFPELQLVFVSSRTYAGYATTPLNPEPYAYQSGFAIKWLIEDQMARLEQDRAAGPWIGWGPYLWTDGTAGRGNGFVWTCDDVAADGTHPSPVGQRKVAALLVEFFLSHPLARSWFTAIAPVR